MQVGVVSIDGRPIGTVSFTVGPASSVEPFTPAASIDQATSDSAYDDAPKATRGHRPQAARRHREEETANQDQAQGSRSADKGDESPKSDRGAAPHSNTSGGRVAEARQHAIDQLRHEGVPEGNLEAAGALLTGQALAESNLNPRLTHDQGTGYGIYGARNERRAGMLNWMANNGYAKDSLEGQMKYMAHEAMTGKDYGPSRKALMNAAPENMREASHTLTSNFERPAVNNSETRYYNSLGALKARTASTPSETTAGSTPTAGANTTAQAPIQARGVDPRITSIVSAAAKHLPEGYKVEMTSGYRGPNSPNHSGHAADFHIVDPKGNVLRNRGEDPTGMYQTLARHAYGEQQARHPELNGKFAWGGAFGTALGGGGERDLMHFDTNGERGRHTDYHMSRMGSVPGVKYGEPAVKTASVKPFDPETDVP